MPVSVTTATRVRLGANFALLWWGEAVSSPGTATAAVLVPLLAVTYLGAGPGWMGLLTASAWLPQLLIVALVVGTATVFFRPAFVKLLPLIVPDRHLEPANARLFGTESAMQVAGPGLAGLLTQLTSAATGIVLNVVGFWVSALCLWRMRIDRPSPRRF